MDLRVRPFASEADYHRMIDYFHDASDEFLAGMGVDRGKLPSRDAWFESAWRDHRLPETDPRRERFHMAWLADGTLVGHSCINQIEWGVRAFAHLHLWRADLRRSGAGSELFRRSVTSYFDRFDLKVLCVEPYSGNPAPRRVLGKLGFRFVGRRWTVPGPINVEQEVDRYEMTREDWSRLDPS
jgi:RimJ/RimL family protein N-acetyltransferase